MEDYIINMAIGILLTSIKNKSKKKALKAALLKVYRAIQSAYPGDKDFA